MAIDCPADGCDFFLWDGAALCPACGRLPIATELLHLTRRPWIIMTSGLVLGLALSLLIRLVGPVGMAVLLSLSAVALAISRYRLAARRRSVAATTIDCRYQDALDRYTESVRQWSELHRLRFGDEHLSHGEEQLLAEAQSVASVVATRAVTRCEDLAARYVNNSLERLAFLADVGARTSDLALSRDCRRAVAITEQYLTSLWIGSRQAAQAQDQLNRFHTHGRSQRVLHAVASVSLFAEVDDEREYGDVAHQARRLRIERELDASDLQQGWRTKG